MKSISDYVNFRDLGSYTMKDGRKIKDGLFFRSGALSRLSEAEKKEIERLGIKCILDLRSKKESLADPDPIFEGVEYLRHSGVESTGGNDIDFSPNGMRSIGEKGKIQFEKLKEYYRNIPYHNESLHVLIDNIRKGNVPIIFHCFSGKDRTGVAAMLIMALLGADDETIMEDYLLSNSYCKKALEEEFERSAELIRKDPEIRKLLQMLEGVEEEIGRNVLESIKERYGTFENYFLEEYGIDADELDNLRNRYLL